jgi:hypothetical protein
VCVYCGRRRRRGSIEGDFLTRRKLLGNTRALLLLLLLLPVLQLPWERRQSVAYVGTHHRFE